MPDVQNQSQKPKSVAELLAEGKSPSSVEVTKLAAVSQEDGGELKMLLQFLVAKEAREAKKEQEALDRLTHLQLQRDRNAKDQDSKLLAKQAMCKHLKGGKQGPKTQNKDYAVAAHVFINFVTNIRCLICGAKWYPKDTKEYLVRIDRQGKERKISNHTKIGWVEAVAMADASTNTMSKSEALPAAVEGTNKRSYVDASGLPVIPRVVDLEGEVVSDVIM